MYLRATAKKHRLRSRSGLSARWCQSWRHPLAFVRLAPHRAPSRKGSPIGWIPIGPFELGDLIGLDVGLDVISYLRREVGDSYYTPPRILKDMVRAGRLGRKPSAGFYDY